MSDRLASWAALHASTVPAAPGRPAESALVTEFPVADLGQPGLEVTGLTAARLPDGRTVLATCCETELVGLWDLDGNPVSTVTAPAGVNDVAIAVSAAGGGLLVIATGEAGGPGVFTWDLSTGHRLRRFPRAADDWHTRVAVGALPDGRTLLAAGDRDGAVRLWDLTTGEVAAILPAGEPCAKSTAVAFGVLDDGRPTLAAVGARDRWRLWSWDGTWSARDLTDAGSTTTVAFGRLADGRAAFAVGTAAAVTIYQANTGDRIRRIARRDDATREVPLVFLALPDGRTAIAGRHRGDGGDRDTSVVLWDAATGARIAGFAHPGEVTVLARVPGPLLATGDARGRVRLWRMPAGPVRRPGAELRDGVDGLLALGSGGRWPPLGLLTQLVALLDPRQPAPAGYPGLDGLRRLGWPAPARIGLAVELLLDQPVDEEFVPPPASPDEARAALYAALAASPASRRPAGLYRALAAAARVDEHRLTLLTVLGPEAVAADPLLPRRLSTHLPAMPALSTAQRDLLADRSEAARRSGGVERDVAVGGIERRGPLSRLLPSQLALPPALLALASGNGTALYRQRAELPATRLGSLTIVLDTSPATYGPPERLLRLLAHLVVQRLWRDGHSPRLVAMDGSPVAGTIGTPAALAAMWSRRTLEPPDLPSALRAAAACRTDEVLVLTEWHLAAESVLPPRPRLRLVTTHMPGDPPRHPAAGGYRWHLPPDAGAAAVHRAVDRILAAAIPATGGVR